MAKYAPMEILQFWKLWRLIWHTNNCLVICAQGPNESYMHKLSRRAFHFPVSTREVVAHNHFVKWSTSSPMQIWDLRSHLNSWTYFIITWYSWNCLKTSLDSIGHTYGQSVHIGRVKFSLLCFYFNCNSFIVCGSLSQNLCNELILTLHVLTCLADDF